MGGKPLLHLTQLLKLEKFLFARRTVPENTTYTDVSAQREKQMFTLKKKKDKRSMPEFIEGQRRKKTQPESLVTLQF